MALRMFLSTIINTLMVAGGEGGGRGDSAKVYCIMQNHA